MDLREIIRSKNQKSADNFDIYYDVILQLIVRIEIPLSDMELS